MHLEYLREGFAGPEGEPSAGCSEAQRNPQKPDPKGRAQIKINQTRNASPKLYFNKIKKCDRDT
ncbi:MAG: hypothetical protein ACO259_06405, partial [Bacteroidia bacterium]